MWTGRCVRTLKGKEKESGKETVGEGVKERACVEHYLSTYGKGSDALVEVGWWVLRVYRGRRLMGQWKR